MKITKTFEITYDCLEPYSEADGRNWLFEENVRIILNKCLSKGTPFKVVELHPKTEVDNRLLLNGVKKVVKDFKKMKFKEAINWLNYFVKSRQLLQHSDYEGRKVFTEDKYDTKMFRVDERMSLIDHDLIGEISFFNDDGTVFKTLKYDSNGKVKK